MMKKRKNKFCSVDPMTVIKKYMKPMARSISAAPEEALEPIIEESKLKVSSPMITDYYEK